MVFMCIQHLGAGQAVLHHLNNAWIGDLLGRMSGLLQPHLEPMDHANTSATRLKFIIGKLLSTWSPFAWYGREAT